MDKFRYLILLPESKFYFSVHIFLIISDLIEVKSSFYLNFHNIFQKLNIVIAITLAAMEFSDIYLALIHALLYSGKSHLHIF